MRYIKCRDYDKNDAFPYLNGEEFCKFKECDQTLYEYWQPYDLRNDDFDTIILLNGVPVKVRSCHFDFVEA